LVEHEGFYLGVVSSSPTLSITITLKKFNAITLKKFKNLKKKTKKLKETIYLCDTTTKEIQLTMITSHSASLTHHILCPSQV